MSTGNDETITRLSFSEVNAISTTPPTSSIVCRMPCASVKVSVSWICARSFESRLESSPDAVLAEEAHRQRNQPLVKIAPQRDDRAFADFVEGVGREKSKRRLNRQAAGEAKRNAIHIAHPSRERARLQRGDRRIEEIPDEIREEQAKSHTHERRRHRGHKTGPPRPHVTQQATEFRERGARRGVGWRRDAQGEKWLCGPRVNGRTFFPDPSAARPITRALLFRGCRRRGGTGLRLGLGRRHRFWRRLRGRRRGDLRAGNAVHRAAVRGSRCCGSASGCCGPAAKYCPFPGAARTCRPRGAAWCRGAACDSA